ncbi:MAG: UDP-N-acetylglucosamine 2-epimerase (non-hydrolyzing) [Desulfobacteraceae bacterium 4572_87]|nr:MAG: UDP-N-acetylglucosamine 2-epimerase (non-hydrolyzing) [Desulfobacteraceae bacterium 4572_87]
MNVIDLVAGARPNFMKLAPVVRALRANSRALAERKLSWRIVHTGQHYDRGMNDVFFSELGIPEPDVNLNVGSGSHGAQTARILERYESHLLEGRSVATVVFGDVNSTVACALAAVKLGIPVVHVEAGLRSFDRSMPEEINRIVTDALSSVLLVSEPSGVENLKREGVDRKKIQLVGNVMMDTLAHELPRARGSDILSRLDIKPGEAYALVTLHRPANVDDPAVLKPLLECLADFSKRLPMIFPMHPRTRKAMDNHGLQRLFEACPRFRCISPLPYRENLCLMNGAKVVLTDSGGMQEETTFLKVPCLTLRNNTERPITVEMGTSRLVGNDPEKVCLGLEDVIRDRWSEGKDIPLWDGRTGDRIVEILLSGAI